MKYVLLKRNFQFVTGKNYERILQISPVYLEVCECCKVLE